MMLTGLADVLRKAGIDVVETGGWKERGHGGMVDVLGNTMHHTASGRGTGVTLGLHTVWHGRPGLDGPLAHLYVNRAGTHYVVAAGLCYHAGVSIKSEYENRHRIGTEMLAAGDGWSQDWPPAQYDAAVAGADALAQHYGYPVAEILGHKETCWPTGRKIDPSFDMAAFRSRVLKLRAQIKAQEENPMATKLTNDQLTQIADAVWNSDRFPINGANGKPADPKNPTWQADSVVAELLASNHRLEAQNAEVLRLLAEIAAKP